MEKSCDRVAKIEQRISKIEDKEKYVVILSNNWRTKRGRKEEEEVEIEKEAVRGRDGEEGGTGK